MFKDQKQEVSEGSSAIQAGGNVTVTHNGLTYSEVRAVALDVFKANFLDLSGRASETAKARGAEVTDKFLQKLERENKAGLENANDPDFQYALYTVQKEYARTGDVDLGDLLVDLLVDRSKHQQRDILQIVLNESLNTAPKLTDAQLASLAVIFLFRYTEHYGVGNHEQLGSYFDRHVKPFIGKVQKNDASYQHLQFSGCAVSSLGRTELEHIFAQVYLGQFLKGFDKSEVSAKEISIGLDSRFFMPCLNDSTRYQVRANNPRLLEKYLDGQGVTSADRTKILELFSVNAMSQPEIKAKCIEVRPYMAELFDVWATSPLGSTTLTSVGIAIGHANVQRFVGKFADLSIWIN
ncbi:LPO_1073/Vpar_1526 family protein [Acidovorax sp.]|uniref:LPO_1073/Vpar_1526 family protein n=1 Tax=Acidovorax sp. TaxID=1872122 RepID=UPI002ACD7BE8|nr:LPO_1073/Vpar_1526 family protein [Acidovorax sp.]MDZ7862434.1 LPO_1073/Vpar_1526 family protein [Acidovorax sp.]